MPQIYIARFHETVFVKTWIVSLELGTSKDGEHVAIGEVYHGRDKGCGEFEGCFCGFH